MTDKARIGMAAVLACLIAAPAEGLRQWAYRDPVGILTVCMGHTGRDVVPGRKYSLVECDRFLDVDMKRAIWAVEMCAPGLPPHVLAAFGDAVFNVGPRIACGPGSTAARYLAAGDIEAACNELPKWDKARVAGQLIALPGLTKRRAKERHLCLTGELP